MILLLTKNQKRLTLHTNPMSLGKLPSPIVLGACAQAQLSVRMLVWMMKTKASNLLALLKAVAVEEKKQMTMSRLRVSDLSLSVHSLRVCECYATGLFITFF